MARPKQPEQLVAIQIRLPQVHLATLDLICLDPFTNKLVYGQRNKHITAALTDYFQKHFPSKAAP